MAKEVFLQHFMYKYISPAYYETDWPSVFAGSEFTLISPISAVMKGRCGREWGRAAGRCLISVTTWFDQKGGCNSTVRHRQCGIWVGWFISGKFKDLPNEEMDCIFIPKFYLITALTMWSHCWNAQQSSFLLAVRSVAQRNDDVAAITSWYGDWHGASEELLTVHGYPVIGDMAADLVSYPSGDWVSRIFDRVTTHRPGLFHPLSLHMMFLRLPTSSSPWAWCCVLHILSFLISHRRPIKSAGKHAFIGLMTGCHGFLCVNLCLIRALWVNAICGFCYAKLSWTWSVNYLIIYALVAV